MTRERLPEKQPLEATEVKFACDAIFSWDYESSVDELRNLYAKGIDLQWHAVRDLDWGLEIDLRSFAESFTMGGLQIQATKFWQTLPLETRCEIARRTAEFSLSQQLHGEQGGLMTASQMVSEVPDMDGKFYAACQAIDEARHLEVFSAYVKKLGTIQPITPALDSLLRSTFQADDWMFKAVSNQLVLEGLALYSFRDMRAVTSEPLFKQLLTYVIRDEARHVAFGLQYLRRVVGRVSEQRRAELEDFSFETTRMLLDPAARSNLRDDMLRIWADVGIDPQHVVAAIAAEYETIRAAHRKLGHRMSAVTGFILPTLKSVGLLSERIQRHFEQVFSRVAPPNAEKASGPLADRLAELPANLDEWVLQ